MRHPRVDTIVRKAVEKFWRKSGKKVRHVNNKSREILEKSTKGPENFRKDTSVNKSRASPEKC